MSVTQSTRHYSISMQTVGRRLEVSPDQTLLDAAQLSGVELMSLCGGIGACDSCKVRLVRGKLSALTLEEEALFTPLELEAGYRLACQAKPLSDVVIDIPSESLTTPQRLQLEGVEAEVPLAPLVQPVDDLGFPRVVTRPAARGVERSRHPLDVLHGAGAERRADLLKGPVRRLPDERAGQRLQQRAAQIQRQGFVEGETHMVLAPPRRNPPLLLA